MVGLELLSGLFKYNPAAEMVVTSEGVASAASMTVAYNTADELLHLLRYWLGGLFMIVACVRNLNMPAPK